MADSKGNGSASRAPSRKSAILRRWVAWTLLLASGTLTACALLPVLVWVADAVSTFAAQWNPWGRRIVLLVPTIVCIALLVQLRAFRWGDLKSFSWYPPTWLAGITGGLLLARFSHLIYPDAVVLRFPPKAWGWALVVLGTSAAIASLLRCRWLRSPVASMATPVGTTSEEFAWLQHEEPIEDPKDDLLGFASIAKRIAARLQQPHAGTIAITGPYGSGKTSVINLATKDIDRRKVWIVKIEGWGIDEKAAPEHILECVLDEMHKHVDCLPLARLPSQYREALSSASPGIGGFLRGLLEASSSPEEVLARIDGVLEAAGVRLLIILEDLDRNHDQRALLSQISALLDRLRNLSRVTFLIAIGTDHAAEVDLLKLCEQVESLPPIRANQVGQIVREFCEQARSQFPEDVVLTKEQDSPFKADAVEMFFHSDRDTRERKAILALSDILRSPRALKHALRHASRIWANLHGEVRLEDIVIVRGIKAALPGAFSFLVRRADEIRGLAERRGEDFYLPEDKWRDHAKAQRERLRAELAAAVGLDSQHLAATEVLMTELFPAWVHDLDLGKVNSASQRVAAMRPTDYWRRLLAEEVRESPRDQEFISAIETWRTDRARGEFASLVASNNPWSDKLRQFSERLESEEVHALAEKMIEHLLTLESSGREYDAMPGFKVIWGVAVQERSSDAEQFAMRMIEKSIFIDLAFALKVEHYWARCKSADPLTREEATRVREGIERLVRDRFRASSDLIEALRLGDSWTLYHLVIAGGLGIPSRWQEWRWMGPLILRAAKEDPAVIVPQLVQLVGRTREHLELQSRTRWLKTTPDTEFINEFFVTPADRVELWGCLAQEFPIASVNTDLAEAILSMREHAKKELERLAAGVAPEWDATDSPVTPDTQVVPAEPKAGSVTPVEAGFPADAPSEEGPDFADGDSTPDP